MAGGLRFTQHEPEAEASGHWAAHWNALLGMHFAAHHSSADRFARPGSGVGGASGRTGPRSTPSVIHARLRLANPRVYASEHDMADDAFEHEYDTRKNYISHHEDPSYPAETWFGHDDHPGERPAKGEWEEFSDWHDMGEEGDQPPPVYRRTQWLNLHPDKGGIVRRFRERLQAQGHDGIVYGNNEPGERVRSPRPEANVAAIAFHPGQVEVVKHHALGDESRTAVLGPATAAALPGLEYEHTEFQDMMGPAHLIEAHHPEHGPVGYAEIREKEGPGAPHVEISRLWTTREHRGTGIGSALLGEAERHYRGREVRLKPWPEDDEVGEDDPDYQDEEDLRRYYGNRGFRDMPGSHGYMTKQASGYHEGEGEGDEEDQYDACYYCQREHNPHEHEEQQSFVPGWDQVLPDVKSIHRVLPLKLPEREHAIVHDPATPPEHAAGTILRHLAEAHPEQGHMHWTSQEGLEHSRASFGGLGRGTTSVVLHARTPDEGDIDDDPSSLIESQVHPYGHPEYEVPIAPGADVHLTGVSWAHARTGGWGKDNRWHEGPEQEWHHHDFRHPMRMEAAARWVPSSGIFAPTTGLDHRLFDEQGSLRLAVHNAIMARLDQALRADARLVDDDWHEYLRVYLAGGSASEWAGSRPNEDAQDLDVLIGADYEPARRHSPALASMDDAQADAALNAALRGGFNESDWKPSFGGRWNLTGYVNHAAYDVRAIKPYAAYDVSRMSWAVKPPHLPEHTLADFDPAVLAHARAVTAQARAVLAMPEPLRTREARDLWEHVHAHRCVAFSPAGEGWRDPGNLDEKWLAYAPGNVLGRIRELALTAKTASSGDPVFYHGTNHPWSGRPRIPATSDEDREIGRLSGFYTTTSNEDAARWGEHVTSHRIDIRRPLHVEYAGAGDPGPETWHRLTGQGYVPEGADVAQAVRDAGHDGVIVHHPGYEWHVAVHPSALAEDRPPARGAAREPSKTAFLANIEAMGESEAPWHQGMTFYHGTDARLRAGDEVEPRPTAWQGQETPRTFFTTSLERASVFGHLKAGADPHEVHVYEVSPAGEYEHDPVAGRGSFRSLGPLRVAREVEPHPFLREFCPQCAAIPGKTAFLANVEGMGDGGFTFEHRPGSHFEPHEVSARHPGSPGDSILEPGEAGRIQWRPDTGEVVNVRVHDNFRRQGLGTELWNRARAIDPGIRHSDTLSDDARQWMPSLARQGAHVPGDEPAVRDHGDIGWDDEAWATARREPWHAAAHLAQQEVRMSHPKTTMEFPRGDEGNRMVGHLLRYSGYRGSRIGGAFVTEHRHPENGTSNPAWDADGFPGVALHPDRWDYGTAAHEAAHHVVLYENGRGPNTPQTDEQVHGREWARAYALGLNKLSRNAGDDFLHHHQRLHGVIQEGLRQRDQGALDAAESRLPSSRWIREGAAGEKPARSKDQVDYRPSGRSHKRCATCSMIRLNAPDFESHSCTLVRGLIDPGYVCDEWDAADGATKTAVSLEPAADAPTPVVAAWDSSGSEKSGVYLRFGHWPENERSFSGAGGYHEEGVSAYDLDRHGNPAIDHGLDRGHREHDDDCDVDEFGTCQYTDPEPPDNDPREEMQGRVSRAEKNRRWDSDKPHETGHLVRGEMSGVGYDGEPLLKNVRRVGDWIDHRHLFIPGASPHRLARDPHDEDYEPPEEMPPTRHEAAADHAILYHSGGRDFPGDEEWVHLGTRLAALNRARDWQLERERRGASPAQAYVKEAATGYTGITSRSGMIYLDLPEDAVRHVKGGVDDHHVTVVYLGKDVSDEAFAEACRRAELAAAQVIPLSGFLRGVDSFEPGDGSDEKVPAFVPAYIPGISKLRALLEDLNGSQHRLYRPHVTLAYLEPGEDLPAAHPRVDVSFDRLHVKRGGDIVSYPLGAGIRREAAAAAALYHGSGKRYREGDLIDPAVPHKKVHPQSDPGKVYFSDSLWNARNWANVASPSGKGHVYEVEPAGEYEEDPHYSGAEERGIYDLSADPIRRINAYQTGHPLRVIRRVPPGD